MKQIGLLVLLSLHAACACQPVTAAAPVSTRDTSAQYKAAVGIIVPGSMGSGVLLDSYTVLTAAHVVDGQDVALIVYGDVEVIALVEARDEVNDLARLKLSAPIETMPTTIGAVPTLGSEICVAAVVPQKRHRCGEVQPDAEAPGDIVHNIITEPGNSGSGVYNMSGELVGIATHLWQCNATGQICGGKATSLFGRSIVP